MKHTLAPCLKNAFDPTCADPVVRKRQKSSYGSNKEWDHEPWLVQQHRRLRHKKISQQSKSSPSATATESSLAITSNGQEQQQQPPKLGVDPTLLASIVESHGVTRIQRLAQLTDLDQLVYVLDHLNNLDYDNAVTIDDETIIEACRQADAIPHQHAVQLLRAFVTPRLIKAATLLPRQVSQQLLQIQNHRAVLQGIILEVLCPLQQQQQQQQQQDASASKSNNNNNNQIIVKLVQQFSPALRHSLITDMLQKRPWKQQAAIITVVDKAMSQQPLLTTLPLSELLHAIKLGVQMDPKAKGYMQLLLTLTSKYGSLLVSHLDTVEQIAQTSDMFLKRAVLGQVASIRKKLTE
ncbi:hypothetical protein BDB00DRAFT_943599 [Zychaea mexicana]|uniref:uncharacterized protein n=1 Tax=Zychaea mexicana TaxID=64656 RepID=UPI0022FEFCFB|nr:uncharacterized protein BDB00DRAFT_943599 [Zychaea mexicana]KAI9474822.1 hypothetical protein BDB00DRAFT_943599 [Zychaea mexicana]